MQRLVGSAVVLAVGLFIANETECRDSDTPRYRLFVDGARLAVRSKRNGAACPHFEQAGGNATRLACIRRARDYLTHSA